MVSTEQSALPKVTVDDYSNQKEGVEVKSRAVPVLNSQDAIPATLVPGNLCPDQSLESDPIQPPAEDLRDEITPGNVPLRDDGVSLGDELRFRAVPHAEAVTTKSFWPSRLLDDILTIDRIVQELSEYGSVYPAHYDAGNSLMLAHQIRKEYRRVFALLCLLEKGPCIKQCIQEGLKDTDLPLEVAPGPGHRLCRSRISTSPVQCFQQSAIDIPWKTHDREYITDHQQRLDPVVFDLDPNEQVRHIDLSSGAVLPFVRLENPEPEQRGGFATVEQVEVHPDCHRFRNMIPSIDTKNLFALKRLDTASRGTEMQYLTRFNKEVEMCKQFGRLKHDHLVTLLVSWTRPRNFVREYCLLFPLAHSDLDLYWEKRSLSSTTVPWISKQIVGLTDALRHIHDPPSDMLKPLEQRTYGRHGDLKPENILWYDSPSDKHGILVIADMGASAVNSMWSRSAIGNKSIQHTPRYKPPECDLEGGKISRSYDIWTFGCVLLELVCWCFEGQEGRKSFNLERFAPYPTGCQTDMFFDIKPALRSPYVVLVKEAVTKRIAYLHQHPQCTPYFHELLYLVEEEMIVTVSETKNRITSAKLYERVAEMHNTIGKHTAYYQTACAMPRSAQQFNPVEAVFQSSILEQVKSRTQRLDLQKHTGPVQRTKSIQQLSNMN